MATSSAQRLVASSSSAAAASSLLSKRSFSCGKTASILCPCANVRRTCAALLEDNADWTTTTTTTTTTNNTTSTNKVGRRRGVRINDEALARLASQILVQLQQQNSNNNNNINSSNTLTAWDEHEWHYTGRDFMGSVDQRQERVALYILALDAINFCFWPTPEEQQQQQQQQQQQNEGKEEQPEVLSTNDNNENSSSSNSPNNGSFWVEYEHLATTLKYMAQRDDDDDDKDNDSREDEEDDEVIITKSSPNYAFSPQRLASITVDEMTLQLQEAWNHQKTPSSSTAAAAATTTPFILYNMKERCRLWNELGSVLLQTQFQGSATLFLQQGLSADHGCCCYESGCDSNGGSSNKDGWSACSLVQWLIQHCSGFRDEAVDDQGRWICFYKRAQICVADLHGALDLTNLMKKKMNTKMMIPEGDDTVETNSGTIETSNSNNDNENNRRSNMAVLDALTTFADYRVPQYLRHVQVLEYSPSLAAWIDQGFELNQYHDGGGGGGGGRMQELYIRAATVVTAQRLVEECHRQLKATTAQASAAATTTTTALTTTSDATPLFHLNDVLVDWYLWQLGEGMLSQMKPHHRVRTIYY